MTDEVLWQQDDVARSRDKLLSKPDEFVKQKECYVRYADQFAFMVI
ncbi:hypothetical protein [Chryseobacterium luquanense]|uniref:Uncharacterized protein n=1 Tax=Chryseobacterium luquanense TaxID=2983766 RepID=A0ABT3Y042_9FLAO|nr:hypothetical protein [Chryseobacterium luquanense]MCX8531505.1 hypothetical protein [Chryseobacterium luquanense]